MGTLFRFPGAEHIAVASSQEDVEVRLSTQLPAEGVRAAYTDVFGIAPAVDIEPDESDFDSRGEKLFSVGVAAGTASVMLAFTEDFELAWLPPIQVFADRSEETARVYMRQYGDSLLDFRHKAFLAEVAEPNVREQLGKLLNGYVYGF